MYSAKHSIMGDEALLALRSSTILAEGSTGRFSASPIMRRSGVSRLCSCAVTASPVLTTALIAARLALV